MRNFSASPKEMFVCIWRNRELIKASTKREVLGRYRGSAMGLLWSFFNPLLMLAIYTFVFSEIFKSRWSSGSDSKTEFALVLFAGLIVFNLFAECINRSPNLIISNVNYVKKVIYPLEILPFVVLLSSLYHLFVSLVVWLVAYLVIFGAPHFTLLYLPLVLFPFVLLIMGLSWMLASLGVYLRDVGQIIGLLTTMLMFLSPIFYPVDVLPEAYQKLFYFNPITLVIEQVRAVLYFGDRPNFMMLALYWFASSCTCWVGFCWFQKTRKGFADVL